MNILAFESSCDETGVALVDAGLREMRVTGRMHNRVRMVVASWLTKHLLTDWRAGEAWFWDTLVDADLANNDLGWQWSAGKKVLSWDVGYGFRPNDVVQQETPPQPGQPAAGRPPAADGRIFYRRPRLDAGGR